MKDIELILRFFTLLFDGDKYERPMEGALNRFMSSNRKLQRHSAEVLIGSFVSAIQLVCTALGSTAFRPIRAINAAVFDAVMVGLARRLTVGSVTDLEHFKEAYAELLENEQFQGAYVQSTSAEESVRQRLSIATERFKTVR